jgi:hypothetical protein
MTDSEQPKVTSEKYIEERYKSQIDYYWGKSKSNKNMYKQSRSWIIALGALVTLISSLSTADFIQSHEGWRIGFAVATPVLAAVLTVLNGLSQNFHWGATWRDMVVSATRLQKEKDRILATSPEKRNFERELDTLNAIVLEETTNFFQRVLDSEVKSKVGEGSLEGVPKIVG